MRFGSTEIPRFSPNFGGYVGADAGGVQTLLNFRSGPKQFRVLSFNDIKTGKFNPSWIRDRIVLIGMTAPSVKDVISSIAISGTQLEHRLAYGVEIQAHAVSQIVSAVLDQRPLLRSWPVEWEYVWIGVWGLLHLAIS